MTTEGWRDLRIEIHPEGSVVVSPKDRPVGHGDPRVGKMFLTIYGIGRGEVGIGWGE